MSHANVSDALNDRGYLLVSHPIPRAAAIRLYREFDNFITYARATPDVVQVLDAAANAWKARDDNGLYYSGYFTPYYRDSTKHVARDQKQVLQLCEEYVDQLSREHPVFGREEVKSLFGTLRDISRAASCVFDGVISTLGQEPVDLTEQMIASVRRPPLVIRVIRYEPDADHLGTNPHVDKTAFSALIDSSDDPGEPSIAFAKPGLANYCLDDFLPPEPAADEKTAIVFPGAALREAHIGNVLPTPHLVNAIRGVNRRYSLLLFRLLPGIDMSPFDTAVPISGGHRLARRYVPKVGSR